MTPPLIEARGLTVRRGGRAVLDGVSLHVAAGEIVTLIGPNGSGKTTLLRALLGLESGQGAVRQAPGLRIGYVPQRLAIDRTLPLTARRLLSLPHRVDRATAEAALARTGVPDVADRQVADLSGGQFQRVLLARALLADPQLLMLDEPTQGLDQAGEAAFYRLIADLRAATGCGILLVSHDLHVVMAASDRVVCLNGHVCCEGAPAAVSAAPEYRALFGLGTRGALALYRHEHDHSHDGVRHDGHGDSGHGDSGHGHGGHHRGAHGHGGHHHGGHHHGAHDHRGHDHGGGDHGGGNHGGGDHGGGDHGGRDPARPHGHGPHRHA